MFHFKIFLCSLLSVLLQPVKVSGQDTTEVVSFLVKIPGGTYAMGDQFAEGWNYELPVHRVAVKCVSVTGAIVSILSTLILIPEKNMKRVFQ